MNAVTTETPAALLCPVVGILRLQLYIKGVGRTNLHTSPMEAERGVPKEKKFPSPGLRRAQICSTTLAGALERG